MTEYKTCTRKKCYGRMTKGVTRWVCLSRGCLHTEPIERPEQLPDIITIHRVEGHGGGHRGRHRQDSRQVDVEGFPDVYEDE